MAKKPKPPTVEAHALDSEAADRLAECRKQKAPFELDMRECYFFASPMRMRQVTSMSAPSTWPLHDDVELQTSIGYQLAQDFGTEATNTFMPQAEEWCERAAGMFLPDAAWKQVKDQVRTDDKKIFEAMKSSNLYPEIAKAFIPDLWIGTSAIHIDQPQAGGAITCLAVPLRELEINLGPYGEIDDRFIVRHTKQRQVRALLPDLWDKIPADLKEKFKAKPDDRVEVRWGWWRKWEERGDECWQHVVMIGERVVHDAEIKGEGCCALIVMRFGATADWAFGVGQGIQSLPTLRQTDELSGQKIAHIELNLTPPLGIPNESFAAMEQGLEAGMAYPTLHGTNGKIEPLYNPGSPETGIYAIEDLFKELRKLSFVDYPEQTGDTPPTLGQWLDELARAQRRIGTPGLPFWNEGPAKIFLRFKYLLEKAGVIKPVTVDGKAVSLRPYNPAQRAAEQQEIAEVLRGIQICGQAFPEEFKMYVDGKASMEAILDKMRVTLLKFRDDEQLKKALPMIQQLLSPRATPGATPQPAAGVQ